MSNSIDVETIYLQERQRRFHEDAPRTSLREHIASSVLYWIIVVALVLFTRPIWWLL